MFDVIICKVVVVWEVGKFLMIEDVQVVLFKVGEVCVKLFVIGVCYIDVFILLGEDLEGIFFVIFGYEGGGVVELVGEGVMLFQVGDYVILFYILECGECKFCKFGKINLC